MTGMIRLKPLNEINLYIIQSGPPSIKNVSGEKKTVIPLSTARFMQPNILETPPSDTVMFMHDNGFSIDETIFLPSAMRTNFGNVELYKKGELAALSTDSDRLIESHHVLQIVGALPSITGEDISDVRAAEGFINDYHNFKNYKSQQEISKGILGKLKARLGLEYNLPESSKIYRGKINNKDLSSILQSLPLDSSGERMLSGTKTTLVIAAPILKADELTYLLAHPEELDELRNCKIHDNYGVIRGVRLLDTPAIISASQGLNKGQDLEGLSSPEFYEASLRDAQLRSLLRKSTCSAGYELVLSPVNVGSREPKIVFGPDSEVTYLQGAQLIAPSSNGEVEISQPSVKGLTFKYDQRINLDERLEKAEAIAHVAVFGQTADLSREFRSPRDLEAFDGDVRVDTQSREIFERHFRVAVNNEGNRIEQEKGVKISGVVLSAVHVRTHMVDLLVHIGTDPKGEYRLAATYLV